MNTQLPQTILKRPTIVEILDKFNTERGNYLGNIYRKSRMSLNIVLENIHHLHNTGLIESILSDGRTKKYIITSKGKEVLKNLILIKSYTTK